MTTDDRDDLQPLQRGLAIQRELERIHTRLDRIEQALGLERSLRDEVARLETSRRELADQAAHLVEALGEARREANWFKRKLSETEGSAAD